jgi:hypothetical protein
MMIIEQRYSGKCLGKRVVERKIKRQFTLDIADQRFSYLRKES